MPSWNNVRDDLRTTYKLEDDEGSVLSVVWRFPDDRSQKVVIRHFKSFEREMVEIKSAFARGQTVDPTVLLNRNSELPLGTIALSGDLYFVVYNTPLTNLVDSDLRLYMSEIASIADALEKQHGSGDTF